MPEQNNDRLEQFFRKAATRSDVEFNEDDWKKLETRLDAMDAAKPGFRKAGAKVKGAVIVGLVLLFSSAVWVVSEYGKDSTAVTSDRTLSGTDEPAAAPMEKQPEGSTKREQPTGEVVTPESKTTVTKTRENEQPGTQSRSVRQPDPGVSADKSDRISDNVPETSGQPGEGLTAGPRDEIKPTGSNGHEEKIFTGETGKGEIPSDPAMQREIQSITPDVDERNKQKAVVELPGAEEEGIRGAVAMVQEEHASDSKKHVVPPRLSLLLSFAPDFSGTRMGQISAPGKAYGAVLHYHFFKRWSISAGVIKNHKEYTSAGEDYHPPRYYWKYNTNGIIPETIDGSCSILEFPVMVQYNAFNWNKHKINVSAGLSSYLMQTESYRYYFGEPNPGAKEGWNSRKSSRFYFNMINISVGYERQVLPGLLLGIEPYAKVPVEVIGWSNIKLFSAGASVTLRYTILRRRTFAVTTRSRGPD